MCMLWMCLDHGAFMTCKVRWARWVHNMHYGGCMSLEYVHNLLICHSNSLSGPSSVWFTIYWFPSVHSFLRIQLTGLSLHQDRLYGNLDSFFALLTMVSRHNLQYPITSIQPCNMECLNIDGFLDCRAEVGRIFRLSSTFLSHKSQMSASCSSIHTEISLLLFSSYSSISHSYHSP